MIGVRKTKLKTKKYEKRKATKRLFNPLVAFRFLISFFALFRPHFVFRIPQGNCLNTLFSNGVHNATLTPAFFNPFPVHTLQV